MRVQDFKRWHWVAISIVVGLILGFVRFQDPTDTLPRGTSSMAQTEFERSLIRTTSDGEPLLQNMRVYSGGPREIRIVGTELTRRRGQKDEFKEFLFVSKIPYTPYIKPIEMSTPSGRPYTVVDYMEDLEKKNSHISYKGVWWTQKPVVLATYTLGSMLLIGGIWPFILNFLIGAGWGAKAPPDPEYDLNRFNSAPEAGKAAKVVSPEEMARLRALEEEMERNLAAGASPRAEGAGGPTDQQAPEIKKLSGGVYDAGQAVEKPDDPKDYKGEFYPVAKQGHKSEEHK